MKGQKSGVYKDLRVVFGRVSACPRIVSESGFERVDVLRWRNFTQVNANPQVMQSLKDCLSLFFESKVVDVTCPVQPWHLGFGWSRGGFWNIFGDVSRSTTKEAELVVQDVAVSPEALVFPLPNLEDRSGVVASVQWWALVWVRARIGVLLLWMRKSLCHDLLSDLLE